MKFMIGDRVKIHPKESDKIKQMVYATLGEHEYYIVRELCAGNWKMPEDHWTMVVSSPENNTRTQTWFMYRFVLHAKAAELPEELFEL